MNDKCPCCLKPLAAGGYHPRCLRALFGTTKPPTLPFDLAGLRERIVAAQGRVCLPGSRAKAGARVDPKTRALDFAAVGWTHILKPDTARFPEIALAESVLMSAAAGLGLPTPPHALLRMSDATPCFVVRRFDRAHDGSKLHVESLYQLLEASEKDAGALESVGKALRAHAHNVGLDSLDLFERALFCFLIGDGDRHLKKWALLTRPDGSIALAPCCDLVPSKVYSPAEDDSSLTINGKHNKLAREDFLALAASLKLDRKAVDNSIEKLRAAQADLRRGCEEAGFSSPMLQKLLYILDSRRKRLFG